VAPQRPRNRPVFYVRKVIGRRKVAGRIEFKVRWQGFGPGADTWEPRSGLPTDPETQEQVRGLDAAAQVQEAEAALAASQHANRAGRQWFEQWLDLFRDTIYMCVRTAMAQTQDRTILRSAGSVKIRHATTGLFVCPEPVFAMVAGAVQQALFTTAIEFSTKLQVPLDGALAYRSPGCEQNRITIPAPQAKYTSWGEEGQRTVYVLRNQPRDQVLLFSPAKGFVVARHVDVTDFVPIKMWLRRSKNGRRPVCIEASACVFDEGQYVELVQKFNL